MMNKILKPNGFLYLFACFISLTLALAFYGCKKPEKQDAVYKGTANAFRNGEFWDAECNAYYWLQNKNEVSLSIDRYNDFGEKREHLAIVRIPLKTGFYKIVKRNTDSISQTKTLYGSFYDSLTADGDAVDGVYYVLESDSNYLEITKIDLDTKDFMGKFSVSYVKDTTFDVNPDLPDTLRFTNGEFKTKIQESW